MWNPCHSRAAPYRNRKNLASTMMLQQSGCCTKLIFHGMRLTAATSSGATTCSIQEIHMLSVRAFGCCMCRWMSLTVKCKMLNPNPMMMTSCSVLNGTNIMDSMAAATSDPVTGIHVSR